MEYGLIGAKLGHSYSKIIHEAVCGYSYELHPLPTEEEAHAFMQAKAFKAINVTIPYKKLVIPYCDEVEPRAAAIGAVNTVVNRDGKLYGYNTDYTGFAYLARCHGVKFAGAVVLVLHRRHPQHRHGCLPGRRSQTGADRQPHRQGRCPDL